MCLLSLSKTSGEVLAKGRDATRKAMRPIAQYLLKVDISVALMNAGYYSPSGEDIEKVISGYSKETLDRLLNLRTLL